jgi:hypothetical protein
MLAAIIGGITYYVGSKQYILTPGYLEEQAALCGVLLKIRSLNLSLLALKTSEESYEGTTPPYV